MSKLTIAAILVILIAGIFLGLNLSEQTEQQHMCMISLEQQGWSSDSVNDLKTKMGWSPCEFKKAHDAFKEGE